jgi:hypothetical protein
MENDNVTPPAAGASVRVGHFDICKAMALAGQDIRMSTLENVVQLTSTHKGKDTRVTIGVAGDLVGAIGIENRFVGGLLLCDRTQYFAMRDKLQKEWDAALPPEGGETA